MTAKYTCHFRQNSRFVFHLHSEEKFIFHFIKRLHRQILIAGTADSSVASKLQVSGNINHITDNSTCRRHLPGTSSVKHRIIHSISVHKNSIERIPHGRQGMLFSKQHRIHSHFNPFVRIVRNCKQLDHTVKLFCIGNIFCCDLCDSFCINIFKLYSGMKGNGGKDRGLSSGIQSFHIRCRICLCISQLCCFCKCSFKTHVFFKHLG